MVGTRSHEPEATPADLAPVGRSSAAAPQVARVLAMQRGVGNAATARYLARAPLDDAIKSRDADTITNLRGSFRKITPQQLIDVIEAFDKLTWVDWDDEKTVEMAWQAVGGPQGLTQEHWDKWWKKTAGFGCSLKSVPWLYEYRMSFAEKTRAFALKNLETNTKAVRDEAKRLGINVDGGPEPAPSEATDKAVEEQNQLAIKIRDAHAHQQELRHVNVGYHLPSWGTGSPPGGKIDEPRKPFGYNPENRPPDEKDKGPDIADYDTVKATDEAITRTVAKILNANPALYALTAQEHGTGSLIGKDAGQARAKMAESLKTVIADADRTRGNIDSQSLGFEQLMPVHDRLFANDPVYGAAGPFGRATVDAFIKEEGGNKDAAIKAMSIATIALITTVTIASGGTATPLIGAVISMVASGAGAADSWADWSRLETAAKATVSDDNALVTKDQADSAMLGAVIDTAFALLDVYGVGKAARGAASAASKAAVSALEGRVKDAASVKPVLGQLAKGEVVKDAEEAVAKSVATLGPGATLREVGKWEVLAKNLKSDSAGMKQLTAWREDVFKKAGEAAMRAAPGTESEAARAVMAAASGLAQVAVDEAFDAVMELVSAPTQQEENHLGTIGVGGGVYTIDLDVVAEAAAAKAGPAQPPATLAKSARTLAREYIVPVPFSQAQLSSMGDQEFERIIRLGVNSGYFNQAGLPRMSVVDGKINASNHGYDGLGISKQANLIELYNLECKHVTDTSEFTPKLSFTGQGTQGGMGWGREKARMILTAENEFAEETRRHIQDLVSKKTGRKVEDHILEQTLADALARSRLFIFTPVWARTHVLLAQLRGFARHGVTGTLIRIAPRRRG